MKNILILIAIATFGLVSCKSEQDKLNERIEQSVLAQMKNPKSTVIDSISKPIEIKKSQILINEAIIYATKANEELLEAIQDTRMAFIMSIGSTTNNEYKVSADQHKKTSDEYIHIKDSLSNLADKIRNTKENTVCYKVYKVYGQSTNGYGAMVNINVVALTDIKGNDITICEDNIDEVYQVILSKDK